MGTLASSGQLWPVEGWFADDDVCHIMLSSLFSLCTSHCVVVTSGGGMTG